MLFLNAIMHNDNLVSLLSNKEKTAHYLCRNSLKTPKQAWTELKLLIYWSLPTVIYANCVLAVLWTWSHLWPAAIEMCLFNRQIKFMASFSTTRLPLRFQEEEYDPSIVSVGAGSPLSLSPSRFSRSLLLPPYSTGPSSYPFLSAR